MRCSVIQDRLGKSTPSVNSFTGKDFAQQSMTCVRSAQHAKEQKQQIRNMANCHINRLKQIPGTLYVKTSLVHIQSLKKEKIRLNCGALQLSILPQTDSKWHKYPIKRLQKLQISPRKLGSLVTHFHNGLCLTAVPNLWLNLPKCVTMTMD